jgi:hypothetical protein
MPPRFHSLLASACYLGEICLVLLAVPTMAVNIKYRDKFFTPLSYSLVCNYNNISNYGVPKRRPPVVIGTCQPQSHNYILGER